MYISLLKAQCKANEESKIEQKWVRSERALQGKPRWQQRAAIRLSRTNHGSFKGGRLIERERERVYLFYYSERERERERERELLNY